MRDRADIGSFISIFFHVSSPAKIKDLIDEIKKGTLPFPKDSDLVPDLRGDSLILERLSWIVPVILERLEQALDQEKNGTMDLRRLTEIVVASRRDTVIEVKGAEKWALAVWVR